MKQSKEARENRGRNQSPRVQVNNLPPRQKQVEGTETQKVKGGGGVSGGVNGDRSDVGGGFGTGGGRNG